MKAPSREEVECWMKMQNRSSLGKYLGSGYSTNRWKDFEISLIRSCWIWLRKGQWQTTIFRQITPRDKCWDPTPYKVDYYL